MSNVYRENWFKAHWRPAAAWTYLVICIFDFILAPLTTMMLPVLTGLPYAVWTPLSLQGGGLIHLSFGGIIGVYTWNRTREKLEGGGQLPFPFMQAPSPSVSSSVPPPPPTPSVP